MADDTRPASDSVDRRRQAAVEQPNPEPRDADSREKPILTRASEKIADREADTAPTPGLTFTHGLRELPNSRVPGFEHSHVHGPQQSPVDPVAAGLDTTHDPLTRAENRVVTLTGKDGAGPNVMGADAPNTHENVPAPEDDQAPIGQVRPARED